MSSHNNDISILVGLIAIGAVLFYRAIVSHRRLRMVQDTPRSKVSSAAQGLVELQGFAWPYNDKCLPNLNQKETVYYDFQLQQEESTGSGNNRRTEWVTVFHLEHKPHFLLVDPTGLAVLNPMEAEFSMMDEEVNAWGKLNAETKDRLLKGVLSTASKLPTDGFLGGLFGSKYRVVEKYILRGSPLYACGDFRTNGENLTPVKTQGLTRFSEMIFNLEARSEKDVTPILDQNKDGKLSHREAVMGYANAAATAMRQAATGASEEREFPLFGTLQKSEVHKLFLAPALEKHLTQNLRYKPALYLVGGSAALAVSVVLLLMKFGVMDANGRIEQASKQPAATAIPSADRASIEVLHARCVANLGPACAEILSRQSEFQLSPQHIQYYSAQACKLGQSRYCR